MKTIRQVGAKLLKSLALVSCLLLLPLQGVNAQTLSTSNKGDAVIVPYYTVLDGWATLINLTNVSPHHLALKVRVHEGHNSRDVLDFTLLLSPFDVWTASLTNDGEGRPVINTSDLSCTAPTNISGATGSEVAYTGLFSDGGSDSPARMAEGYVEILTMGMLEGQGGGVPTVPAVDTAPYYAEHVGGVPRNCELAAAKFEATDPVPVFPAVPGSGNPEAADEYPDEGRRPLSANVTYVNTAAGIAGGHKAVHLEFWGQDNLVTAQQFPWFLEPTLGSNQGLWTIDGLGDVEESLSTNRIENEWSNNPANGVATDWIVTFPTKGYHVDVYDHYQATCNIARGCDLVTPGLFPFEQLFNELNGGQSQVTVNYDIYDREEGGTTATGVVISPTPPGTPSTLPYEANVITMGNSDVGALVSPFSSALARTLDTNGLASGSQFGWTALSFPNADFVMPAVGYLFKSRDFGDPALSYGQIMDHAYVRFQ